MTANAYLEHIDQRASEDWWQHHILVRVDHRVDRASLVRAIAISRHQLTSLGQPHPAWTLELVEFELECQLYDYGAKLQPGWFVDADYLDHKEEIESVADMAAPLIGKVINFVYKIENFSLKCILARHLEVVMDVKPRAEPPEIVLGRIEGEGSRGGPRFVRIPAGGWGLAEPPQDVYAFHAKLQTYVAGMTRQGLNVAVGMLVAYESPWQSGRTYRVNLIDAFAERLLDACFPELAQCDRVGLFYVKERPDGSSRSDFCNHVCAEHARGRAALIGEPRYNDDGTPPRRCCFSKDVPVFQSSESAPPTERGV